MFRILNFTLRSFMSCLIPYFYSLFILSFNLYLFGGPRARALARARALFLGPISTHFNRPVRYQVSLMARMSSFPLQQEPPLRKAHDASPLPRVRLLPRLTNLHGSCLPNQHLAGARHSQLLHQKPDSPFPCALQHPNDRDSNSNFSLSLASYHLLSHCMLVPHAAHAA